MAQELRYISGLALSLAILAAAGCQKNAARPPQPAHLPLGAPADSPIEVVGGTLHICTAANIAEASSPYTVTADTTAKVNLHGVLFAAGTAMPNWSQPWLITLSNLDNGLNESTDAVTLTTDSTTPSTIVDIAIRNGSVWKHDKNDLRTLKFHDEGACPGDSEGSRCDHLVNVTVANTAPSSPSPVTGQCLGGACRIVIGTPGTSDCE
jgi:hypothetical protein